MENNIVEEELNTHPEWIGLDALQERVMAWQRANFPDCEEWELALGVSEEAGELAQCILKMHRGMRSEEFDEARLQDAVGDTIIYLMGICSTHNWRMSEVLRITASRVLARKWR